MNEIKIIFTGWNRIKVLLGIPIRIVFIGVNDVSIRKDKEGNLMIDTWSIK